MFQNKRVDPPEYIDPWDHAAWVTMVHSLSCGRPGLKGLGKIAILIASLSIPVTALAQNGQRQVFELGTSTTDRASHALGVTIAALVKLKLLPRGNIDVNAVNTSGSRTNVTGLRQGDLDFAILNSLDAYQAANGTGPFLADGPDPTLRLLANLWTSSLHFFARSEFAPTGKFEDFLNLKGRKIALGREGSPTFDLASALFNAKNVDIDQTYAIQDLDGKQAIEAFLEGDLDGFLLIDDDQGVEIETFLERAGEAAALLSFEQRDIDRLNGRGPKLWTNVALQTGAVPNEDEEKVVLGIHNLLSTNAAVPEEAVYQITETIFDNLPFLEEMHSTATGIDLDRALDQVVLPVHEGAASYYRDVGVTVPEPQPISISALSQSAFLTGFDSVQQARLALSESSFTILGGGIDQTIKPMVAELATLVGEDGIRVIAMTNPKPAENIADILYARGVDSAILPLDILDYALEQDVYPGMRERLVYLTELFTKELHLVAGNDIRELDDLIDQPVNLGPKDSASAFTTSFLLDWLNIPVKPTYLDQRTALEQLAEGELAAAFLLSGKPMPILEQIPAGLDLHLIDLPRLEGRAYLPATFTSEDYPNLLADGETIGSFGVRTGLFSYSWRSGDPRFSVHSAFMDRFFERLPALQDEKASYHPKWREIDPYSEIENWRRSPAVDRSLQSQNDPAEEPIPSNES